MFRRIHSSLSNNGLWRRRAMFVRALTSEVKSSQPTNSNYHIILGVVAVLTTGTLLVDNQAYCADERLSKEALMRLLAEKIKPTRAKLQALKRKAPLITVRDINFEGRFGDVTPTHVLEVSFKPTECNLLSLVMQWLHVLGDTDAALQKNMDTIREFYADPKSFSLPIVSADRTTSMTISKSQASDGAKVSVALFKDHGFSPIHVDRIVSGYFDGFSNDTDRTGKNAVQFQFEPLSPEGDRDILKKFFSRGPMRQDMMSGDDDETSAATGDPIQDLKSLGVEVFDKSNNAEMTWDQLAGYSKVKERIQETVVLALQYPDIYDQVAKQTRAYFESNRPKAVLLEGPPGTGKTLTARILASQCDAPLVVLKLESIVSKWYGDSEKKLSKILDACDRIEGGAILFVDEIDAMATSRDSEAGMHEVTRRVLSVLLTRLEGFKGKSKSIMIGTTNRRRDLDPALLSRFDLTISYALPDAKTREEIFQRYAKQFMLADKKINKSKGWLGISAGKADEKDAHSGEEKPYRLLAEASEGLSCRDIKEACQQAERMCASRFIREEMAKRRGDKSVIPSLEGGKELFPTLEDYLQCLRQRQLQQRAVGMGGEGRSGDDGLSI